MKKWTLVVSLVLAASQAAWPALAPAAAQKTQSVAGVWQGVARSEGTKTAEFRLELVQKGSIVTGTVIETSPGSDKEPGKPIRNGTFQNGRLKFQVQADDGSFDFEGLLKGDKLTGAVATPFGRTDTWEAGRR